MSSRKDTIEQLTGDPVFMKKWRDLIKSGDMDKILELCNCYRGSYAKDHKPDLTPHVQSENNGGMKAWDKLEYLINSLPFSQKEGVATNPGEYVGYVKDRVANRRQLDHEDDEDYS